MKNLKMIVMTVLTIAILVGCSGRAEAKASSDDPREVVPVEVNQDNFMNLESSNIASDEFSWRTYGNFEFRLGDNVLWIDSEEYVNELGLVGTNFILGNDNKIWFINDNRRITSFDLGYSYLSNTADAISTQPEYVTYGSADLESLEKSIEINEIDLAELSDNTGITCYDFDYTVVIEGNSISTYTCGEKLQEITTSANIKMLANTLYHDNDQGDMTGGKERLTVLTEDNTVGMIVMSEEGIEYRVIEDSEDPKSLVGTNSLGDGEYVYSMNDWAVYEKSGEIVASDGNTSFSLTDDDVKEMRLRYSIGTGKGYTGTAVIFKPEK